jgi:hypothetical protein
MVISVNGYIAILAAAERLFELALFTRNSVTCPAMPLLDGRQG